MSSGKQTQDGKRDVSRLQQLQDRDSLGLAGLLQMLQCRETLPCHAALHKQRHAQLSFAQEVDRAEEI